MKILKTTGLLLTLCFSSLSMANEADITRLESRLNDKVQHMIGQGITPSALEEAAIKIRLVADELQQSGAGVAELAGKYRLDPVQVRQLKIIVAYSSGGGMGIEP